MKTEQAQGVAGRRSWLVALVGLGALVVALLGLVAPATASADTTAPSGFANTSCHPSSDGAGSCVVHIQSIPSSGTWYAAIFVSSDSPWDAGETMSVQEGETFWTLATSDSYVSPDNIRGYSGIFTKQLSGGPHDVTISQSSATGQFLAVAYVFNNSSGFEGAASSHTDSANPSVSLTASSSNRWAWCVAHDWTASQAVYTGSSGFDEFQLLNDNTNGDTMAVYNATAVTSGSGTVSCGPGTASWSGDEDTVSGIVVKGLP